MSDRPNQGRGKRLSLAGSLAKLALAEQDRVREKVNLPAPDPPEDFKLGQTHRPRPGERPTTMPRDQAGQHINPSRRQKKAFKAAYKLEHGRRMNGKAIRRHVREKKAQIPAMLDSEAMLNPKGGGR